MGVTIDQFRRESAKRKRGRRRGAASYPVELRRFAVEHADAVIAAGGSVSGSARELGVSEMTLAKWMETAGTIDDGPGGFREVVVERQEEAAGAIAVVSPVRVCWSRIGSWSHRVDQLQDRSLRVFRRLLRGPPVTLRSLGHFPRWRRKILLFPPRNG